MNLEYYCPKCLKRINQGDKFCSSCGQNLTEKDTITDIGKLEESQNANNPNLFQNALNSDKKLKIIGYSIGIILATIILFVSFGIGKDSPSDVAEEFIKYSQEEDYYSAEELWSQDGIEYMLSQLGGDERWIDQTMKNLTHHTNGDLDGFEIISEEKIESDKATVFAKLIFDSGEREEAQFAMIKENGKWKVFAFDSN